MTKLDDILLGILDFTPQTKAQSMEAAQKAAIKALMLETYCKAQELSPVKEPVEFTDTFNELVENL